MATERNTTFVGPYATAARLYRAAGWPSVLPVGKRAGEKWPPPHGWTGHDAPNPTAADVEAWIETHGDRNIGLRAPVGVLGLDVDAYEKDGKVKAGGQALADLVAQYGPLPPTWVSGARPAPSGIYWFRVPTELDGAPINWPGEAAKGIELIQHGHRYGLVWPSTNPEADGARYEWVKQGGFDPAPDVPSPSMLSLLPDPWVRGLALSYARTEKTDLGGHDLAAWWDLLRPGQPCRRVTDALVNATQEIAEGRAGRHETARDAARTLAAYGGEGHVGTPEALTMLGQAFVAEVGGRGRDAEGEWMRLLSGAVGLAATDNPSPRQLCACAPPSVLAPAPPLPVDATTGQVVPVPLPDERVTEDTLTDSKIAQAICDDLLHGTHCWAPGLGWMTWTGQRWQACSEESVIEVVRLWLAKFVGRHMENVFVSADRATSKAITALESAYRLGAITRLCRGVLHVDAAAFDSHADLLNTPSGIVDLRTGALQPHDPHLRMTKITEVAYVPGAVHPDWPAALSAVASDVAEWLQIRFGQSITGHMTPDDKMLFLKGGGENGKSTVLNAVKGCLGGYGVLVSDKVLLADPKAHSTEMTTLLGARFALAEELPDEGHLKVKRLKDVIGTPEMTARKIRQDEITWQATHSFFVSTNYLPKVTETDHGTWRRLVLVDFPYKYVTPQDATGAEYERPSDPGLRDRMKHGQGQREAVLAWLVAGAARWYEAGKQMPPLPDSVLAATQKWRRDSDLIVRFWAECLAPSREHYILSADMHTAFTAWSEQQGHRGMSVQTFTARFGEHDETRTNGVMYAKRRVRAGETRSVPVATEGIPFVAMRYGDAAVTAGQAAVGVQLRAWWGVRFVSDTTAEQH